LVFKGVFLAINKFMERTGCILQNIYASWLWPDVCVIVTKHSLPWPSSYHWWIIFENDNFLCPCFYVNIDTATTLQNFWKQSNWCVPGALPESLNFLFISRVSGNICSFIQSLALSLLSSLPIFC
jgi:hypothetical protein